MRLRSASLWLIAFSFVARAQAVPTESEKKAIGVLSKHCYSCHGKDGNSEGGVGDITNPSELISNKKLIPGNVELSRIIIRLSSKRPMPPAEDDNGKALGRLSGDELALVKAWVKDSKPAAEKESPLEKGFSSTTIQAKILADLGKLGAEEQKNSRYLTFHTLVARKKKPEELQLVAESVLKILSSVISGKDLAKSRLLDLKESYLMRLDLRDLGWTEKNWKLFIDKYNYTVRAAKETKLEEQEKELARRTGSELAYVRADWFVAVAQQTEMYRTLLGLPARLSELKTKLKLSDKAEVRSGFLHSGVALGNRMFLRRETSYGKGWYETFDVRVTDAGSNMFQSPLVPSSAREKDEFGHAGGEAIWLLENDMLAYVLYDNAGNFLSVAPIDVVDPPKFPHGVLNFTSCMRCHQSGLINREDEIAGHVKEAPEGTFSKATRAQVASFHKSNEMQKLMEEDNVLYAKALATLDRSKTKMGSLATAASFYQEALTRDELIAEFGEMERYPDDKFYHLTQQNEGKSLIKTELDKLFLNKTSKASRSVIEGAFPKLVDAMHMKGKVSSRLPFKPVMTFKKIPPDRWSTQLTWHAAKQECVKLKSQLPTLAQMTEIIADFPSQITHLAGSFWTRDIVLQDKKVSARSIDIQTQKGLADPLFEKGSGLKLTGDKAPSDLVLWRAANLMGTKYLPFFLKEEVAKDFTTSSGSSVSRQVICVAVE